MNKPQVFKLYDFPSPISIHVLATHKEEEGFAISDELHQVVKARFKSGSITPGIITEVGLFALKAQARRCLDVLRTNGERFVAPSAPLGRLPSGVRCRNEKVEVVTSNGTTGDQDSPLTRGLREDFPNFESGWGEHAVCNLFEKRLRRGKIREPNIKGKMLEIMGRLHAEWRISISERLSP